MRFHCPRPWDAGRCLTLIKSESHLIHKSTHYIMCQKTHQVTFVCVVWSLVHTGQSLMGQNLWAWMIQMSSYYLHSLVHYHLSLQYSHDLRIPGSVCIRGSNDECNTVIRSSFHLQYSKHANTARHNVAVEQSLHTNHTTGSVSGQHLAVSQWCLRGSQSQKLTGGIIKL
jgi:hypothetical protein